MVVGAVASGSPAEAAGFESGDVIYKVNGEDIVSVKAFQEKTLALAGNEVVYDVSRENGPETLKATPRQNPPAGQGALGVQLAEVADVSYPWYQAIGKGLVLTWEYLKLTLSGFGQLIGGLFGGPGVSGEVAGPIGIAVLTGKFAKIGIVALMQFTALLSINLAVINALPIPALDGGRILFLLIEGIRGKKVRAKVEQWSHAIGFALLLALMLLVTIADVLKLF